jgi:hypothetical protein
VGGTKTRTKGSQSTVWEELILPPGMYHHAVWQKFTDFWRNVLPPIFRVKITPSKFASASLPSLFYETLVNLYQTTPPHIPEYGSTFHYYYFMKEALDWALEGG